MNRCVNSISGRLSLRAPQRKALEILARVVEIAPPHKGQDVARALEVIHSEYPSVAAFEREFPSLCFALATGVGKTRLMGAFVAYLHLVRGVRHFFVLAPNLTIYEKLIRDFTPGKSKYVLQGIAEFAANPPEIITGDNYESGRGVRRASLFGDDSVHINIFNISKINTEVRGGKEPRIKRLSEYIGESYFGYLAGLDDLVLLMDESHRYRATAGVRAINELQPILGLELTATPQVEAGGRPQPFQNVIYSYPLAQAITDGFVKRPAVATRENFDASNYTEEQLERLKLEDGVRIHEDAKADLDVYARQNDQPVVKPFMLVVARDTDHANALHAAIEDESFFAGRYRGRVITVHSNQTGEEREDTVRQLLSVEDPTNRTEIVIHVNMLKEGWDVTNLYTIVPLRRANSRTLVEQSIGRGLRLPYGKRVGVSAVDRLTIVAHDRFQEIIDEANDPNSIIRQIDTVFVGGDTGTEPRRPVTVEPEFLARIGRGAPVGKQHTPLFETPAEQQLARTAMEVLQRVDRRPGGEDVRAPEVLARVVREVRESYVTAQGELEAVAERLDVEQVVAKAAALYHELTIDIPRLIVVPRGEATAGFVDFDLDTSGIQFQPVAEQILIQHLGSNERERLGQAAEGAEERRLEDYLVRALIDCEEICYDEHADLLYKLAGQVVDHLRGYLADEDAVRNVVRYYEKKLAALIRAQMQAHVWTGGETYEASDCRGYERFRPGHYSIAAGEQARNFREPVAEPLYIRGMLFGGFRRCLYEYQKFDSDPERRFAVVLENEDGAEVLKWFKPARGQLKIIDYKAGVPYEPDFVVETRTAKLLCEPKRASEIDDPEVRAKTRAAVTWCRWATKHECEHGGKPWMYLLIPGNAIDESGTLEGLIARFRRSDA